MMNPHEKNAALAANQTKLVLSHEQLTAVCNILWNHYAMLETDHTTTEAKEQFTIVKASALVDEKLVQTVYESFAGCLMAMEATAKAAQ